MKVATAMAMKYGDIEPNVLQFISTTSMPIPDELFQIIVLVNYLRTLIPVDEKSSTRQSGTRMALAKVLGFSPTAYAARMQNFTGWDISGMGVCFSSEPNLSRTASSSSDGQENTLSPPLTSPSDFISESDMWLSLAVMYRAATLLYILRTLVIDCAEGAAYMLSDNTMLNVNGVRQEAITLLSASLAPVFSNPLGVARVGRLAKWPLFILGMETEHTDTTSKLFVTNGFLLLGQVLGMEGLFDAIDMLKAKWKMDAENTPGSRVTWDDYFQGREDYIVF
jgi:hypothetical protein